MPRTEAMGGTENHPGNPRNIEEFAAGLHTKRGYAVQDGEFALIWTTDPFTGEQAPFYPVDHLEHVVGNENAINRLAGRRVSQQPRVKVFLEAGGVQWCQYGDELWKLDNVDMPGYGRSAIGESAIILSPRLQKMLARRERRRKTALRLGGLVAATITAGLGIMNNFQDVASTADVPVATALPATSSLATSSPPKPSKTPKASSPVSTPSATESAPSAPKSDEESVTSTINTATANLLYSNTVSKVKSIFKTLFKTNHNHVVTVQEGKNFEKSVFKPMACEYKAEENCTKGIAMFPGIHSGGSGRNQIFWDTEKFQFVKGHSELAARDLDTRGRHFKHSRYINWVLLKDKVSGQEIYFINVHAPNSVEKDGRPSHIKTSVKAHKQFMKKLTKRVEQFQDEGKPMVLMGDFNVDVKKDNSRCSYLYFPCRMLDSRMNNMWLMADLSGDLGRAGTQGPRNRLIDRVYYSETNDFKLTIKRAYLNTNTKNDQEQMTGGFEGSDHKPVNVEFTFISTHKKTGEKKQHSFSITLDGVQNFRDAGASSGGRAINKYSVYRSGKLENATKEDIAKLSKLVTKVIDLRPLDIQAKAPDPVIPGVAHVSFPVTSSSNGKEYIQNFVMNPEDREQLGKALTEIANTDGPVIIHCTEGKDRTGWVTALLGMIDGAQEAHIENEFTLSRSSGKFVSVSWLRDTLAAAKKKFGDSVLDGYIQKGLGVSSTTIAKLRAKLGA